MMQLYLQHNRMLWCSHWTASRLQQCFTIWQNYHFVLDPKPCGNPC